GEVGLPAGGVWEQVEGLLRKHGVVFISDDVRCGFRVDMGGSNEYFGYKPDLICFCKALANGYPISALVGSDALREEAAQIFHTGSYWFSAAPMAAALACLKELKRVDAPHLIRSTGEKLVNGLGEIARSHGFDLSATGIPSMPYIRLIHEDGIQAHRRLCGECTQRGAFFSSYHNWFLSASHDDAALERTWEIFEDGLKALEV
ncbi:MAG: aminotransferase class III-fold pyridoxal phosphate-dependent enzyme, partial [Proteobacteria bacterium]|nr:aminotransferase class III-fold pyridoxal phosphate-dependent enzyme [Pseudomonadota bacterium]